MCYHSENSLSIYNVSLKNRIYRTISLSYLYGQDIYVLFLNVLSFILWKSLDLIFSAIMLLYF